MKRVLFILLAVAISGMQMVSAKTWRVNNLDNSADFQSLDDAIAGINAGDTIYLEGSTTNYQITNSVTKKMTVIGPGYYLNENPNTQTSKNAAVISGNHVYLLVSGISFEGVDFGKNIYIGADDITIKRCWLTDLYFTKQINAVVNNATIIQNYSKGEIDGGGYANNAIVANNIVLSPIEYFINSTIENNTIAGIGSYLLYNNSGCTIKNNIVASVHSSNSSCDISNNLAATTADYVTQSTASTDGKYQLSEISSLWTAGTNGSQVGAFGGSSPYVLSGLPSVPHIYEIDAPNTASKVKGLDVTLKIATEK